MGRAGPGAKVYIKATAMMVYINATAMVGIKGQRAPPKRARAGSGGRGGGGRGVLAWA